jgi:hypothetical protein
MKLKVAEQKIRERDYFGAEKSYKSLVEEFPDWPSARFGLAQTYLALGKYQQGFREMECRWQIDDPMNQWYKKVYDFDKWWDGDSLEGKTIIVFCEQGLGDAIHFIRYARMLEGRVVVHVHEPLAPLLPGEVVVGGVGEEPKLPEYDYVCSAMSLPYLLKDVPISGERYLWASEERSRGGVGVVWGGTPGHPLDQDPVTCRSIPVKHFRKLDADLVSLQLEKRPDLGEAWFPNLVDKVRDMRDTAEIMKGLDLIITCDTSTAHLAGALGLPCWLLLPYVPCWRWGIDSNRTPWYNSIRIFRQSEPGNWDAVFDEVAMQLAKAF